MGLVGYVRISTAAQSADLQERALQDAGVERIFSDVTSGSHTAAHRDGFQQCLNYLRDGEDTLIVWRLDRLGRSTVDALSTLDTLAARSIKFRSIKEGLDTSGAMGRLLVTIISAIAECERALNRERSEAGIAAARERGVQFGRPPKMSSERDALARRLRDEGSEVANIAAIIGVSPASIYRSLARTKAA